MLGQILKFIHLTRMTDFNVNILIPARKFKDVIPFCQNFHPSGLKKKITNNKRLHAECRIRDMKQCPFKQTAHKS